MIITTGTPGSKNNLIATENFYNKDETVLRQNKYYYNMHRLEKIQTHLKQPATKTTDSYMQLITDTLYYYMFW